MSNIKNTNPEDIIKDDIKKYCCVAVAPTVGIFLIGCGARENDINYIEVKNPKTYIGCLFGDDPVLLNVGNPSGWTSPLDETMFLNESITKIMERNVPSGFIFHTEISSLYDVYMLIDYMKYLIVNYGDKVNSSFDLPFYVDIDSLMNNMDLTKSERIEILQALIEKCNSNHICLGFYGKDSTLCRAYDMNIGVGEKEVVVCQEDIVGINYPGNYNMIERDGNIYCKADVDFPAIINEGRLNNPNSLVADEKYTLQTDNPYELASYDFESPYEMSPNAILKYNGVCSSEYNPGLQLVIPFKQEALQNTPPQEDNRYVIAFDVSEHQGTINEDGWDFIKNNSKGVFIRLGIGERADKQFDNNLEAAKERGLLLGGYYYVTFPGQDCSDEEFVKHQKMQIENARKLYNEAFGKNNKDGRVFALDLEGDFGGLTDEQVRTTIKLWYKEFGKDNKFTIYCNQRHLGKIKGAVSANDLDESLSEDADLTDAINLWIAGGDLYDQEVTSFEEFYGEEEELEADLIEEYDAIAQQVTSKFNNDYVYNSDGHVDVNVVASSAIITDEELYTISNKLGPHDFSERISTATIAPIVAAGSTVVLASAIAVAGLKRKFTKRKGKRKIKKR